MTLLATLALLLLVTVAVPVATVLLGIWLITAAYDETSVLRRGVERAATAWATRRAAAV